MPWSVAADPVRFEEALEWFLDRIPITRDELARLDEQTRARAFTVARVAQLRIVADVHQSLAKVVEGELTIDEWKKAAAPALEDAWQGSVANPAARLETIARNNVQHAYAAGRERLAAHPTVQRLRPYARFDAVMDSRTTDEICRPLHGVVKAADDPWWNDHTPPLHHNCRSGKVTLTEGQARAEGVTDEAPASAVQDGFGARPTVDDWQPEAEDFPPELWAEYEATAP